MITKINRDVAPAGRPSQSAGFVAFITESAKLTLIVAGSAGLVVVAEALAPFLKVAS